MGLNPRDAAFLMDTMDEIANDDSRSTAARHHASDLREEFRQVLTE